ncbi:alpha-amylase family protein [Nocardioides caldifontis]|uniref:alpha-amylase family protein n=1 Tax=Nocardioides caldifontis TaxID=2588938 RepID=UPI0011DF4DD8|nr:alpha-amylase family protein [Nocardioides caldifontis]
MSREPGVDLVGTVRPVALEQLGLLEGEAFLARLDLVLPDLRDALEEVYGAHGDVARLVPDLVADALAAATSRPEPLRVLDRRREVDPSWFLAEDVVGYVCYADRFAGDLRGVREHLDHLEELGVRYLHLMPLLKSREGENDGGYAVEDYDAVDPRLGTMADLEALAEALHERGIALCVDLVLNHTAREHVWAQKALAGDPAYRAFYRFFPDRTEPDAYERTLPEVFPDTAPGSFTHLPETGEWVWTTFHEYQWDLNWANPAVFRSMLGVLLTLANRGVDVVRLDAAPFLWKRVGTNCQNQPEAHRILQALRALTRLAMPGVLLKAEAIVGPDELVPYLGGHERYRPECDLAYDNQLMVMGWSALAARDARLPAQALARRRQVPRQSGWVTYVRNHDDIGWAVGDEDAWAVAVDPARHRAFLADFYAGRHPGSFASGADFQADPGSGSVRTSGMTASLAGLDEALEHGWPADVDAALRRVELLHAVAYAFGGIPLVYMGDEIAMRSDPDWAAEPEHGDDNRWLHRPRMDWVAAERRHDPQCPEGRIFSALRAMAAARRSTESLRSDADTWVVNQGNPRVLAWVRHHPRAAPVLGVACFSDGEELLDATVLRHAGITDPRPLLSSDGPLDWWSGQLRLHPWSYAWITTT